MNEHYLDTTIDEWRVELEKIGALGGDAGHTTKELAKKFGFPERTMLRCITEMLEAGTCKRGRAKRTLPSGRTVTVPVYQLRSEDVK